jgi:hypothetical protein
MYTSGECRAQVEQKLAQAQRNDRKRKRLIVAAEAWLFLARQLRRTERTLAVDESDTSRGPKGR